MVVSGKRVNVSNTPPHQALHQEVLLHQPQLDDVIGSGKDQESLASATPSLLPDLGYTSLQERYEALKVSDPLQSPDPLHAY